MLGAMMDAEDEDDEHDAAPPESDSADPFSLNGPLFQSILCSRAPTGEVQ